MSRKSLFLSSIGLIGLITLGGLSYNFLTSSSRENKNSTSYEENSNNTLRSRNTTKGRVVDINSSTVTIELEIIGNNLSKRDCSVENINSSNITCKDSNGVIHLINLSNVYKARNRISVGDTIKVELPETRITQVTIPFRDIQDNLSINEEVKVEGIRNPQRINIENLIIRGARSTYQYNQNLCTVNDTVFTTTQNKLNFHHIRLNFHNNINNKIYKDQVYKIIGYYTNFNDNNFDTFFVEEFIEVEHHNILAACNNNNYSSFYSFSSEILKNTSKINQSYIFNSNSNNNSNTNINNSNNLRTKKRFNINGILDILILIGIGICLLIFWK